MAPMVTRASPSLSSKIWHRLKSMCGAPTSSAPLASPAVDTATPISRTAPVPSPAGDTATPTGRTPLASPAGDTETPRAGTKTLDSFTEEFEIGSRKFTLETGKIARFANGAVVLGIEETKVLSTVCSAKSSDGARDFLPLTVDYQEKQFARGVIPHTFMRREGAPKERELLCGRLIDRPIRPLFPKGFYHDVQVMASVLSSDGKQDPDVLAVNATSAALMLSDIPWAGPVGVIRIGRIHGQFIVNPSMDELSRSDLNLVYACTKDKTLMMDVQARDISERDFESALRLAHIEAVNFLEPQLRLASKAGKRKGEYKLSMVSEKAYEKIRSLAEEPIEAVFTDPRYGKFERGEALDNISKDVRKKLEEECDDEGLKFLSKTVDNVRKQVVRRRIISDGLRVDGRRLDEVRPIYCEAGNLPVLHGSSIFNRGDTQVLCTVTLGAPGEAQRLDSLVGPPSKRFMLHYSFPPFCIDEVGKRMGLNRREVGHGTLAEKALLSVLPPEDSCPYTVRINSEVMASDGSTSMASVCAGSMALMDAGIPLKEHVAGLSVGLISEVDPLTGEVSDYRILTDILGLEDHLGDMDFKIAGTRNGITAIQLDIKPAGIPLDIICESLEPAYKGRLQILDHMEREINVARARNGRHAPRILNLNYSNDAIRRLIGPFGTLKRKIEEETGGTISAGDGSITIVAKNQSVLDKMLEKIDSTVGREIVKGGVYRGTVSAIKEYGAFVELNGGQQGLLHISELSHDPVDRVTDVVSVNQVVNVMCIDLDVRGNISVSLKATMPSRESKTKVAAREPVAVAEQTPNVWEPDNANHKEEGTQASQPPKGGDCVSSFLIRSAAECDEEEKSAGSLEPAHKGRLQIPDHTKQEINVARAQNGRHAPQKSSVSLKATMRSRGSKTKVAAREPVAVSEETPNVCEPDNANHKEEGTQASQPPKGGDGVSSVRIRSAECDEEEKSAGSNQKSKADGHLDAKKLRLGMELTAKVHQVRALGLVLDLGGDIHGMYKFVNGSKTDFNIGQELKVKCTSFSSKGIPIMSLVEE